MRKRGCDNTLSLFDTFDGIALIAPASSASTTQPTRPQRPVFRPQSLGPQGACLVFQHHPQVSLAGNLLMAGKLPLNPRQLINRRCPLAGCQRTTTVGRSIVGQELPQECPERKQFSGGSGIQWEFQAKHNRRKPFHNIHLQPFIPFSPAPIPFCEHAPF